MNNDKLTNIVQLVNLAVTLEPPVLAFFMTLFHKAQGVTGDQFLAQADDIYAQVRANAQKELGQ